MKEHVIFNIYKNAGYDDDYVNSMSDRYGYAEGGITRGLMSGRGERKLPQTLEKATFGIFHCLKYDQRINEQIQSSTQHFANRLLNADCKSSTEI